MGRFLDEPQQKTYKGRFMDEPAQTVNASAIKPISPLKEKALSFGIGGPVSAFGGGKNMEDQLPLINQGIVDYFPPTRALNAFGQGALGTGAATIGQAERQAVKKYIRGQNADWGQVPAEAVRTGLAETLFRGIPAFYFRKQIGGAARQAVGKELGDVASKINQTAPMATIAKNPFIADAETALKENMFERGPAVQALANVKKKLSGLNRPLSFDEARQLEQQLGREAQFAPKATQGHFAKAPKTPGLNMALKEMRNKVSGEVDDVATKAGFPQFGKLSEKYAGLVSKYPESELQKKAAFKPLLAKLAVVAAGGGSAAFHHPTFGIPVAIAGALSSIPQNVRTALFRKVLQKPASKAVSNVSRLALEEALRKSG